MSKKRIFTAALFSVCIILGLCLMAGILILPAEISPPAPEADEDISFVPYAKRPDNCGLLLQTEDGSCAFFYLDFEGITLRVTLGEAASYHADYTLLVPDGFLGRLADRIGGVDITENGKTERYFGQALEDLYKSSKASGEIDKICNAFFEKFAKTGLSSEDFMFIIEGVESELKYSLCYDWIAYMPELFANCIYE